MNRRKLADHPLNCRKLLLNLSHRVRSDAPLAIDLDKALVMRNMLAPILRRGHTAVHVRVT
jgi:hypothetical protein